MYEVARGYRPGASAHVSKHNAHAHEQADLSPGTAELLGMGESKKRARGNNAGGNAEFACDHRVYAAAKNCFFDDGRHKDAEAHEHQNALPAAEELFHGDARFASHEISEPAHHDGQ